MTAIAAPRSLTRATRFERMLLAAAAGMDRFVIHRLEARASRTRPLAAQVSAVEARTDAQAAGSVGILPR
jgi:hypothetical protein